MVEVTMRLAEATSALDVGELPFVFFVEVGSGRGAVAHRRYDGHYGLVVPADTGTDHPTPATPR